MARHKRKKRRILFKIFVVFQLLLMVAVVAGLLFYFFGGYGEKISAMQKEAREFAAGLLTRVRSVPWRPAWYTMTTDS